MDVLQRVRFASVYCLMNGVFYSAVGTTRKADSVHLSIAAATAWVLVEIPYMRWC